MNADNLRCCDPAPQVALPEISTFMSRIPIPGVRQSPNAALLYLIENNREARSIPPIFENPVLL
jgi:hypothetical protein